MILRPTTKKKKRVTPLEPQRRTFVHRTGLDSAHLVSIGERLGSTIPLRADVENKTFQNSR